MENYKAELTSLKEELTSRIDAVIAKIEKPNLVSGWYVDKSQKGWIANFDFETNKVYGIDTTGNWFVNNIDELDINDFNKGVNTKATPTEVQEALTNEAVKRGLFKGKYIPVNSKDKKVVKVGDRFHYDSYENKLLISGWACFLNGIWATPIKTKTIEELAIEIRNKCIGDIEIYLTENKQTIIETLNNL